MGEICPSLPLNIKHHPASLLLKEGCSCSCIDDLWIYRTPTYHYQLKACPESFLYLTVQDNFVLYSLKNVFLPPLSSYFALWENMVYRLVYRLLYRLLYRLVSWPMFYLIKQQISYICGLSDLEIHKVSSTIASVTWVTTLQKYYITCG